MKILFLPFFTQKSGLTFPDIVKVSHLPLASKNLNWASSIASIRCIYLFLVLLYGLNAYLICNQSCIDYYINLVFKWNIQEHLKNNIYSILKGV